MFYFVSNSQTCTNFTEEKLFKNVWWFCVGFFFSMLGRFAYVLPMKPLLLLQGHRVVCPILATVMHQKLGGTVDCNTVSLITWGHMSKSMDTNHDSVYCLTFWVHSV